MKNRVLLVALWAASLATAQTPDSLSTPDSAAVLRRQTLDRLLDLSSESSGGSEVLEQFNLFRQQKVDLNRAGVQALLGIPFLSAPEAKRIIEYRERVGGFRNVAELRNLLDEETYELVAEFVRVSSRPNYQPDAPPAFIDDFRRGVLWQQTRFDFINRTSLESPLRFGLQEGSRRIVNRDAQGRPVDTTITRAYLGSAPKVYNRLQAFVSDNFLVSALIEKDVGEQSLADFTSATLAVKDIYNLKSLIVGDFNLSIGQGVAMNTGRAFFKSAEAVVSVKQSAKIVRPYTSTVEQSFLRGAAAEVQFGDLTLIGFYSQNAFSASLNDTAFSSLNTDGLFRTESEIARKQNVGETLFGGHAAYSFLVGSATLNLGGTFYRTQYREPFVPSNQLENFYRFRGSAVSVSSVNVDAVWGNVAAFGEAAYSLEQKSLSAIVGVQTELMRGIKGVILFRQFAKDYFAPRANAFAESSSGATGRNETGLYLGIDAKLSTEIKVRAYYDYYLFPFISSTRVLPSAGDDMVLQVSYKPRRDILLELFAQRKAGEEALTQVDDFGREYRIATPQLSERLRTDFTYQVSPQLRLRTRAEVKHFTKRLVAETRRDLGWLIAQDVNLDILDNKLSIDMRVAVFQTDSFDAAVYAYENDLPLTATIYAHNGRGRRLFINARYKVLPQLELAFRFANVFRDDVTEVGTGNDRFLTNAPSVFSVGVRARF
ncbi:MAG: hypothetical protein HY22_10185 [[Candidatus Thermochlorobacteriaceae] bacterium GBChlB]|nr:MAG: hypothetical protein HY22_10185 [[Candidatus Thermochlorobacteriaceae] bacterium GBChlB]